MALRRTGSAIGAYGAARGLIFWEKNAWQNSVSASRFPGSRILASSPAAAAMSMISRHQSHGVLVMSPHAHARITSIDTAAAKAAPGGLAVLTGADAEADKIGSVVPIMPEDMGGPKGYRTLRPILSSGKVRAVGDRVAFVVAETLQQARDAAEVIAVEYEPLPAVVSLEDAV